eukprot:scaffold2930_cov244-Pinguiococcus_pyrenoidosus.AAC.3
MGPQRDRRDRKHGVVPEPVGSDPFDPTVEQNLQALAQQVPRCGHGRSGDQFILQGFFRHRRCFRCALILHGRFASEVGKILREDRLLEKHQEQRVDCPAIRQEGGLQTHPVACLATVFPETFRFQLSNEIPRHRGISPELRAFRCGALQVGPNISAFCRTHIPVALSAEGLLHEDAGRRGGIPTEDHALDQRVEGDRINRNSPLGKLPKEAQRIFCLTAPAEPLAHHVHHGRAYLKGPRILRVKLRSGLQDAQRFGSAASLPQHVKLHEHGDVGELRESARSLHAELLLHLLHYSQSLCIPSSICEGPHEGRAGYFKGIRHFAVVPAWRPLAVVADALVCFSGRIDLAQVRHHLDKRRPQEIVRLDISIAVQRVKQLNKLSGGAACLGCLSCRPPICLPSIWSWAPLPRAVRLRRRRVIAKMADKDGVREHIWLRQDAPLAENLCSKARLDDLACAGKTAHPVEHAPCSSLASFASPKQALNNPTEHLGIRRDSEMQQFRPQADGQFGSCVHSLLPFHAKRSSLAALQDGVDVISVGLETVRHQLLQQLDNAVDTIPVPRSCEHGSHELALLLYALAFERLESAPAVLLIQKVRLGGGELPHDEVNAQGISQEAIKPSVTKKLER